MTEREHLAQNPELWNEVSDLNAEQTSGGRGMNLNLQIVQESMQAFDDFKDYMKSQAQPKPELKYKRKGIKP